MLYVGTELLNQMVSHAESTSDECCGFLIGDDATSYRTIHYVIGTDNIATGDRCRRFEVAPLAYLAAENFAEKNSLQLLGVYHSHPDHPAVPSELDRQSAQPGFSNMIISTTNKKFAAVRSWRLNQARHFYEETIIEKGNHQSTK